VGVYLSVMAVLTLIALLLSKETKDVDYEAAGDEPESELAEGEAEAASL
jgi:hypothetical protein